MRQKSVIASIALAIGLSFGLVPSASAESGWWVPNPTQGSDSEINVTGEPHRGSGTSGALTGFIDAHTHMFMDLGMGGNAVCGSTFSEKGVADALKDCDNHETSILENLTNEAAGRGILDKHDAAGWPTFKDWPSYSSLTHQQMYYKWVERAWRGGQRVMVNDMVSNPGLCPIIGLVAGPNKYNCNDMDTVRRQIQATYDLEAFIDKQYGGSGKGWYRVVKSPEEAEKVIADGKLAVVLGVEVSEPFGCKQTLGVPGCTKADIDKGLDELKAKGVSSMFLCHKFDNALCGVRYDSDVAGLLVNAGQFITTGTWWNPKPCKEGEIADNEVIGGVFPQELAGVSALPAVVPLYPKGPHCNPRGLTTLGEYALQGLIKRGMIVELDHMSGKAAGRALDILESEGYPGAVSSHSWMNDAYMERMFALGGFAAQYGNNAEHFVNNWKSTKSLLKKYDIGYGFGSDMNGFGGTASPPSDRAKITYPFKSADGNSTFDRQKTGERIWDYNSEGVSHYGMLPDWLESIKTVGGKEIIADLNAGPASYVQTWSAATSYVKGENLARSGKASASSSEFSLFNNFKPGRAIDGSTKTRWASSWKDNQWWQVDLKATRQISKVTIEWESAYAKAYKIQTSHDGKTWTTVADISDGNGALDTIKLTNATGKFVRMQGVKRGTKHGYSIKEFGIFS